MSHTGVTLNIKQRRVCGEQHKKMTSIFQHIGFNIYLLLHYETMLNGKPVKKGFRDSVDGIPFALDGSYSLLQ